LVGMGVPRPAQKKTTRTGSKGRTLIATIRSQNPNQQVRQVDCADQ
jgi:hypothetical protein